MFLQKINKVGGLDPGLYNRFTDNCNFKTVKRYIKFEPQVTSIDEENKNNGFKYLGFVQRTKSFDIGK